MSKRAFWPGFRWRILAHEQTGMGTRHHGTGKLADIRSGMKPHDATQLLEGLWEFDELVIDHWFHLEQMDARVWWMGIGDPGTDDYWHVNVHIDGKGKATVSVDKQSD